MTIEDNRRVAERVLHSIAAGKLAAGLIHEDATFWSQRAGTRSKADLQAMSDGLSSVSATGVVMTIGSITAEGDRVVIESTGDCTLLSGGKYDNTYCFMFVVRDGLVTAIREYNDPRIATAAFGPGPND